jgi:hypothetical protein
MSVMCTSAPLTTLPWLVELDPSRTVSRSEGSWMTLSGVVPVALAGTVTFAKARGLAPVAVGSGLFEGQVPA